MPAILIEVRRKFNEEEENGIMNVVHQALQLTFKIVPTDRTIRLVVHEPHRFACPPQLEKPDYYTLITIDAFKGRSVDVKRLLYREIVDRLEPFGIPANHIMILLRESESENWGIRGGQAACDVDLGFKVDV